MGQIFIAVMIVIGVAIAITGTIDIFIQLFIMKNK